MEYPYFKAGHPVLDPEGHEIRLPRQAIIQLKQRRLLRKCPGPPQISEAVYGLLGSDCSSLMDGLQRVLGKNCEGPSWVICYCDECRYRY